MGTGVRACGLAAVVVSLLSPSHAIGATIEPNAVGDDFTTGNGLCSLREAIEIANDNTTIGNEAACTVSTVVNPLGNDTIEVDNDHYRLELAGAGNDTNASGDLDIDTTGGSLVLQGYGPDESRIDTDDTPTWTDRVLHHYAGTGMLTVSGVRIRYGGGSGPSPGAGTSAGGGAILNSSGSLTVTESMIDSSHALGPGGGIANTASSGSLSITDSIVDANRSESTSGGGGIFSAGNATVTSTVVMHNVVGATGAHGGGIQLTGAGKQLTLTDSEVHSNAAGVSDASIPLGGGVSVGDGSATLIGTTVRNNSVFGGTSGRAGGGINFEPVTSGSLLLTNSTVSANDALGAASSAGGVRVAGGSSTAILTHATLGRNQIGGGQGGQLVRTLGATVKVRDSVIERVGATNACDGTITPEFNNVFGDMSCGSSANDAIADPLLASLAANGGPIPGPTNFEMLLEPVHSQLPAQNSPAVDRVPAAECGDTTQDQGDLPRPFDGDGDGIADCDAGAVELQTAPSPGPSVIAPAVTPPVVGANPACVALRAQRKKAKTKKKRRKIRRRLRALGC